MIHAYHLIESNRLWKVPYYYIGSKVYDILAGVQGLTPSYFMFPKKAKKVFPMVRNSNLYGAMVYYDGAQNDSRMNVALAMTAALHGAVVVNHCEVTKLVKVKNAAGKTSITGAIVRDTFTGSTWQISAKGVINATGPFTGTLHI